MTAYMDHKDLTSESIDETRATQIRDGVHRVLDAIAEAESAAGCAPGSVKLLAATKTRDVGEIMAAIDAGIRMIGENRPQEVMAKAEGLRRLCADRGFALGTGDGDTTRPSDAEHIPFHLIGQLCASARHARHDSRLSRARHRALHGTVDGHDARHGARHRGGCDDCARRNGDFRRTRVHLTDCGRPRRKGAGL